MKQFQNDKFKRQFISSPHILEEFPHWQHAEFTGQNFHIYAHPDLEVTTLAIDKNKIEFILLGFIIDDDNPQYANIDIVKKIASHSNSIDEVSKEIIKLTGRFIFIINFYGNIYIFHDAGGLRSVYYALNNGKIYIGTQPLIFSEVFDLKHSENYFTYKNSQHYKTDTEYWLPCGVTLYENVSQLIPNHYLDITKVKQVRYWPNKIIEPNDLEPSTIQAAKILKNLMYSISLRKKIALPLSAGLDSRMLLAASKDIINEIYIYTSKFDYYKEDQYDLLIPKSIVKKMNIPHSIIDCTTNVEKGFIDFYKSNVDLAHDSWAKVTFGLIDKLPGASVVVQGTISEVTRGPLNRERKNNISSCDQIFSYYWKDWKEIPFIMNYMNRWYADTKETCKNTNIEIWDLFLLEHRTGGWNAQANNEVDIVTDTFSPFNHRPLLEIMLGVPAKYRLYEKEVLHTNIIKYLWPELMYWPMNKRWKRRDRIRHFIGFQFKRIGIYKSTKKIYSKVHSFYMKLKLLLIKD